MDHKTRLDKIAIALKILGHRERLRILALLSRGELTVSELVQILGLSQPRITQYIKSLEEAGIVERLEEGSWVFSRIKRSNSEISAIVSTVLTVLPKDDPALLADLRRLEDVRQQRARSAESFFADVANDRGQLGDDYLPRENIESAMRELAGPQAFDYMVDLGTGTGRMLQVFAERVSRGSGIDSNVDMLKVARHNLSSEASSHLSVRQGDLRATPLPASVADLVTLHQVLHYLDDPLEAIAEAARLMVPGGTLLVADFAPHDNEDFRKRYAHRRLGFSDADIFAWMTVSGLVPGQARLIETDTGRPDVKIWAGSRPAAQQGAL